MLYMSGETGLKKKITFFDAQFYGTTVPIGHFKNYTFPFIYSGPLMIRYPARKTLKHIGSTLTVKKISLSTKLVPSELGLKKN